jgi:hypothetical protein
MITYFRWGSQLREISPALPSAHLSVVDLLADFGLDRSLGDRFRQLDPVFRSADAVLLRSSSHAILNAVQHDFKLKGQLATTPTGVLLPSSLEEAAGIKVYPVPGYHPLEFAVPLPAVRALEARFLIREAGAVLQWEGAHFALPNRTTHAQAFIQISYVLNNIINIERLSDWIAPYLSSTSALVADTAHLLPLLLKLRLDAFRRFGKDLPITTLDAYPAQQTVLGDLLRQLNSTRNDIDTFLLVMSVNSSGRLAQLFSQETPVNLKAVILCHSKEEAPPAEVECFAEFPIPRWPVEANGQCAQCEELETFFVDPATFECKPKQRPVTFSPDWKVVESHEGFWRWVDDSRAVMLHKWVDHVEDGQARPRHHGIYFDMARLIPHKPFRDACLAELHKVSPPDLIIIPTHTNSDLLADFANEAFHGECQLITTPASLTPALRERVQRAEKILLLDDSFLTGSTLLALKSQIYHACQQVGRIPQLDVFVLLARPSNPDWRTNIIRPFFAREDRKPHVRWGHLIYVPKPGTASCPWCEEREQLEKNRRRISGVARAYLQERIRLLEGEIAGPALFAPAQRLAQHLLTLGSFFGDLSEITAFSAASCVAHELATKADSTRGLFVRPEIDLALVIEGYYEAVLLAGMLRTFRVRHLRSAGFEPGFIERLASRPANLSYPGTVGELAWAAAQGKLAPQPVLRLLEGIGEPDSALVMLRELTMVNAMFKPSGEVVSIR